MRDLLQKGNRRSGWWLCFLLAAALCARVYAYALPAKTGEADAISETETQGEDERCFLAEDRPIPGLPGLDADMHTAEEPSKEADADAGADTPAEPAEDAAKEAERQAEVERLLRERLANDPDVYHIMVNRVQNTVTIYERDEGGAYTVPVRAMVCSTGEKTPLGTYQTSRKYEWRPLFGGVYGQYATRITGNILFHSVPYTADRKDTLEYEEYNKLGTPASMGCVRLSVEDAKWIYDYCASGTRVTIYDGEDPGPLGKPEPLTIDVDNPNRGWDPTDPDPANPWASSESSKTEK